MEYWSKIQKYQNIILQTRNEDTPTPTRIEKKHIEQHQEN